MKQLSQKNYEILSKAISYIATHINTQPELHDIAQHCKTSSSTLQRIFSAYAGLSPKQFTIFMTTDHAKSILANNTNVLATALKTGSSDSGRLHNHFVQIESMTHDEYRSGGKELHIKYSFHKSPYGDILIASTDRGICHIVFSKDHTASIQELQNLFPEASLSKLNIPIHKHAQKFFDPAITPPSKITLHLRGTTFQIKVWQALLRIPSGSLTSYRDIAHYIEHEKAHRAVGTAIGHNPIAYIIPCHRVIKASGSIGDYMWGPSRKKIILAHELS